MTQYLLEAITNNEMVEWLEGKGKYKQDPNYFTNISAPTDWTIIIPKELYKLYSDKPELKVDSILEDSLLKMLDREPFDIYVALSVFYFQLLEEQRGTSPFIINRSKLISKLKKTLIENETKLKNYYEWVGTQYNEGVWGEVLRINSLCISKWNFSII